MDKLKLAGQNLGRVFNFRYERKFSFLILKLPNLKWKSWPKQRLGSQLNNDRKKLASSFVKTTLVYLQILYQAEKFVSKKHSSLSGQTIRY
jgi:hypothetical protein